MQASEIGLIDDAVGAAVRLATAAAAADSMWLQAKLTCVLTTCLTQKAETAAVDCPSLVSLVP